MKVSSLIGKLVAIVLIIILMQMKGLEAQPRGPMPPCCCLRHHLWGADEEKRSLAKVKWEKVCKPKVNGGLGIINLDVYNKALLAKWGWRFASEKNSLWRRIMEDQFGSSEQHHLPNLSSAKRSSMVWQNIVKLYTTENMKQVIGKDSFSWAIGNGKSVLFWWDSWVQNLILKDKFPRLFMLASNKSSRVSEMPIGSELVTSSWQGHFRRNLRTWENDQLQELLTICASQHTQPNVEDEIIWNPNKSGKYSVKKASQTIMNAVNPMDDFEFKGIWKLKIPVKVQSLLWLLLLDRVASKHFLKERGMKISESDSVCSRCKKVVETTDHIFFSCQDSTEIWRMFLNWWSIHITWPSSFTNLFHALLRVKLPKETDQRWWISIAATIWTIWLTKNEATFDNKTCRISEVEFIIKLRSMYWLRASSIGNKVNLEAYWWSDPKFSAAQPLTQQGSQILLTASFTIDIEFITSSTNKSISFGGFLSSSSGKTLAVVSGCEYYSESESAPHSALRSICKKMLPWFLINNPVLIITSNASDLIESMTTKRHTPETSELKEALKNSLSSCKSVSWSFRQIPNQASLSLAQVVSAEQKSCNIVWLDIFT